jgi:hypothetical protein
MATTTNYSWTTPDDTALVKDGAAAIRTLGSSIDTTVKNLNPETTLGDLAYRSSTANVKTRLALGTAGQVLQVNSGANAPEWATLASGGMTLISTTTLSGSSVSLSSIPSTYNNLYVVLTGATWGTDTDTLYFQPNNLTTNYGIVTRNKNGTTSNDSLANEPITQRENILRTSVNNVHILEIQNYASASYFKAFRYHGYFEYSTTLPMAFTVAGGIRTNSAITSLVIKTT